MKKRYFGNAKVESKWEGELKDGVFKDIDFKPPKISYHIPHNYTADFRTHVQKEDGKHHFMYIEAKGRFRDSAEAAKYKHIREYLEEEEELVFVFMNPNTPMPFAKRRKCGTKQTHAEWAEKNNFRWFTEDTFPREYLL